MTECNVCCEVYNRSNHFKVSCPKCDYEICRTCAETYLIGTHQEPHCLSCKHEWTREFLDSVCTKSFMNKKLKDHREMILFERERCLMPETQHLVERELLSRDLIKDIAETELILSRVRDELYDKRRTLDNVRFGRVETQERAKFCRKCPVTDCKGFLSTSWKCEICKNKICKDCNEIKNGEDHECDPANVETTKLLNKDTKPCPSCGTLIFKISGCPQMWCTSCHVAFDWNTLRVERGVIHNPHFFDFQRNQRIQLRNPADIPCGGRPEYPEIIRIFRSDTSDEDIRRLVRRGWRWRTISTSTEERYTLNCLRIIHHIEQHSLRWEYPNNPVNNQDIRVKYMMNELEEEKFKKMIQQRDKKYKKIQEIRGVLHMIVNTTDDLLRQMVVDKSRMNEILTTLENLRVYVNDTVFSRISKRYNCTTPHIMETWVELTNIKA